MKKINDPVLDEIHAGTPPNLRKNKRYDKFQAGSLYQAKSRQL